MAIRAAPSYLLSTMSWFPRPSSPRAAARDLVAYVRHGGREQLWAAAMALLITIIIVIVFFVDASINTAPPPRIVYVESWPASRSDAEIKADQAKDEAERQAALKQRQREFQNLENKLGM